MLAARTSTLDAVNRIVELALSSISDESQRKPVQIGCLRHPFELHPDVRTDGRQHREPDPGSA
jgi:hypothetical protein